MAKLYDAAVHRVFAYDDWANRQEVALFRTIPNVPPRALRILNHIIGAQWLWLGRLGRGRSIEVWPSLTLEQCAVELDALREAWKRALPAIDREAAVAYTNSKGERWSSNAGDILTHVTLHGAYHRGQIAIIVRDAGQEPAYTDFIHCTRAGLLEEWR